MANHEKNITAAEAIKLRRDVTLFGREKGDVLIEDHEVSSTHFQLQNIDGDYYIFDMNSTNGTFVNQNKVLKARLISGDLIRAGQTTFRFVLEEEGRLRHISAIFKSPPKTRDDIKISLVDTLIESELDLSRVKGMRLSVRYPGGLEEKIELKKTKVFVGRACSFGHFDQDGELSRRHLMIKLSATGEVFIEDQGSTNGTFLNGQKVRGMRQIAPSDEVRIGDCFIQVEVM